MYSNPVTVVSGWTESSLWKVGSFYFGPISAQSPFGPGLARSNKNSSKIISKIWDFL